MHENDHTGHVQEMQHFVAMNMLDTPPYHLPAIIAPYLDDERVIIAHYRCYLDMGILK